MQEQLAGVCSLSAIWVLGNEFKSACSAASVCTHWAILPILSNFWFYSINVMLVISEITINFYYF